MSTKRSDSEKSAPEQSASGTSERTQPSIQIDQRVLKRAHMTASRRPNAEETDDVEERRATTTNLPYYSFFVAIAIKAANWLLRYLGLYVHRVPPVPSASQATRTPGNPQFWCVRGIKNDEEACAQKWLQELSLSYHSLARIDAQRLCATPSNNLLSFLSVAAVEIRLLFSRNLSKWMNEQKIAVNLPHALWL
jgi:hypothetical protein